MMVVVAALFIFPLVFPTIFFFVFVIFIYFHFPLLYAAMKRNSFESIVMEIIHRVYTRQWHTGVSE